jgi:uncharacterized small protein (DUF1192 family)
VARAAGFGVAFAFGARRARAASTRGKDIMANESSLSREQLDNRIAILRDNIRQLTEQAAASSGAADEARNADRIAEYEDELQRLVKQRDALPRRK